MLSIAHSALPNHLHDCELPPACPRRYCFASATRRFWCAALPIVPLHGQSLLACAAAHHFAPALSRDLFPLLSPGTKHRDKVIRKEEDRRFCCVWDISPPVTSAGGSVSVPSTACQHHCSTHATLKKARARQRNTVSLFIHPQEDKPRIYLAPYLLAFAASPLQAEPASRIAAWSAAHGLDFVARFLLAPAPHILDIRPSSSTAITGKGIRQARK